MEIHTGSPTGALLGTLRTVSTGGWGLYADHGAAIGNVTGVQDIYLVFRGSGSHRLVHVRVGVMTAPTGGKAARPLRPIPSMWGERRGTISRASQQFMGPAA